MFMYFAYRDSQMTGRLNALEDTIERLTSGSDQPSGEYGCLIVHGSCFLHTCILTCRVFTSYKYISLS